MLTKQGIGDNSNNNTQIIAEKVTLETDYMQVREIVKDTFEMNFLKYKPEIQEIIDKRLEEFNGSLIRKIKEECITDLSEFKNPDFLYNLYEAQKTCVRLGDKDQEDVLTSLLLERFNEKTNTLKQIILNEALQVIPKLTKKHINILTLLFILKETQNRNIDTFQKFCKYLESLIPFFEENIDHKPLDIQHLEFTGCGQQGLTSYNLLACCKAYYLEAFVKERANISASDLEKIKKLLIHFTRGINNQLKKSSRDFSDYCKILGEDNKRVEELIDTYQEKIMSDEEILKKTIEICPGFESFYKNWDKSGLKSFKLSSVGKAVGLINANAKKSLTSCNYNLDLWIS